MPISHTAVLCLSAALLCACLDDEANTLHLCQRQAEALRETYMEPTMFKDSDFIVACMKSAGHTVDFEHTH